MEDALKKDFEYYLANQEKLVEKYDGMYLVIKNQQVLSAYSSEAEALDKAMADHETGTFLIQRCSTGSDDYTMTFHSRVAFA